MTHPNATAAGVTGALTIVAVYLAGALGVNVPAEVASAITTIAAAVVLLLGRRHHGRSAPPPPAPPTTSRSTP